MGRRVLERAAERRVADEERRVRVQPERDDLGTREQDADEDDARRALRGDCDRANLPERKPRHELNRVDGALGGDAEAREDPQPFGVARVVDRRDGGEIDVALEKHSRELRGHALDLLHVGLEPVEDGRHVHVRDAAEPDGHALFPAAARLASPSHRRSSL